MTSPPPSEWLKSGFVEVIIHRPGQKKSRRYKEQVAASVIEESRDRVDALSESGHLEQCDLVIELFEAHLKKLFQKSIDQDPFNCSNCGLANHAPEVSSCKTSWVDVSPIFVWTSQLHVWPYCQMKGECYRFAHKLQIANFKVLEAEHARGSRNGEPFVMDHHCFAEDCENISSEPKKDFKRCSACQVVWYCSEKCQRADWPLHKAVCSWSEKHD